MKILKSYSFIKYEGMNRRAGLRLPRSENVLILRLGNVDVLLWHPFYTPLSAATKAIRP
jgi:hypothetical protein